MSDNIERREFELEEDDLMVEERQPGQAAIVGYAARYNRLSLDLGGFREEILPGAFDKILNRQRAKADVVALFQPRQQYGARPHGERHARAIKRRQRAQVPRCSAG
jgi:phage head maturation protease